MEDTRTPAEAVKATLTVDEFAEAVGVHPVTVRRWIKANLVTHGRTPTGRIKIPASALEESLTIHAAESASPAAA